MYKHEGLKRKVVLSCKRVSMHAFQDEKNFEWNFNKYLQFTNFLLPILMLIKINIEYFNFNIGCIYIKCKYLYPQ